MNDILSGLEQHKEFFKEFLYDFESDEHIDIPEFKMGYIPFTIERVDDKRTLLLNVDNKSYSFNDDSSKEQKYSFGRLFADHRCIDKFKALSWVKIENLETMHKSLGRKIQDINLEKQRKNMMMGCFIGLAVGDAYGTTYEFKNRSQMPKIEELPDDFVGGGPFNLNPGDWTDDTSMALCLADSIIENGWDTDDQMKKYTKWWQEGYNSVKDDCFDIGGATKRALSWYNMTEGKEFIKDKEAAGNGVLMRLAPIPMWSFDEKDCVYTLALSAYQSLMTHPSSQSIECSMLFGSVLNRIFQGERDKMKILSFDAMDENSKQMYKELFEQYECVLNNKIESIKKVEYINSGSDKISGDGYCVFTLEAAFWAFLTTDNFKDGLKKVVSLGDDTDTTGAVYGQIAGAYYGLKEIPWKEKITWYNEIYEIADKLYEINKESRKHAIL